MPIRSKTAPDSLIPAFDLRNAEKMPDGKRAMSVRCRIPFTLDALFTRASVRLPAQGEGGGEPETRAAPTQPATRAYAGPAGNLKGPVIDGIASSTGCDQHGTEMSEKALRAMEAQFNRGNVAYLPAHPSWLGGGGEWNDVMGYVGRAEVVPAEVPEQAPGEQGFALAVEVQLDGKDPASTKLCQRVADGYEIGQSIGGWFTEIRYIYAEADAHGDPIDPWDDPERVIIEGVELDHLAATRSPSNTASWIEAVRGAAMDAHTRSVALVRAAPKPAAPTPPAAARANDEPDDPMADDPTEEGPMACSKCGAEMSAGACKACKPGAKSDTIEGATQTEPDPPVVEPAQAAAEQEPTPLPPEDDGTRSVPLDGEPQTGHATSNTGTDAPRGAPGDESTTRPRVTRQESHPMPTDTPQTLDQLQARIRELEAEKAQRDAEDAEEEMHARSFRRGQALQYRGVPGSQRTVDAMITRAREEGATELCDVLGDEGFAKRSELGADQLAKLSQADLAGDLRTILEAAEEDGLLRNPFADATGAWA